MSSLSSEFVNHLQKFQSGNKCLNIGFIDHICSNDSRTESSTRTESSNHDCICNIQYDNYELIEWGNDVKIFDKSSESKESNESKKYQYDDEGSSENLIEETSYRVVMTNLSDSKVQEKILQLLRICGENVKYLSLENFSGENSYFVSKMMKYLTNVISIWIFTPQNETCFDFLHVRSVKSVKIHYIGQDEKEFFQNKLSKVKIAEAETRLFERISNNKNIKELELKGFHYIPYSLIEMLLDSLSDLRYFTFTGSIVSGDVVKMILQKLKKLKILNVYGTFSNSCIEKMRSEYPHVKIIV